MKNKQIGRYRVQYHAAAGNPNYTLEPCPVCGAAVMVPDNDDERIWVIKGRDEDHEWVEDEHEKANFLNDSPGAGNKINPLKEQLRKSTQCFADYEKDVKHLRSGKKVRFPRPQGHNVIVVRYPETYFG